MSAETRITSVTVVPAGEPLWSEMATVVSIADEGGDEFVAVMQSQAKGEQTINIDPSEWPHIRAAIDRMMAECRTFGAEVPGD